MNTFEIGNKLVDLCKQGKNMEAIEQLYAQDIVSVEPNSTADMPAQTQGIEAIRDKNKWFDETYDINNIEVLGPYPHGDQFTVYFKFDATEKKGAQKVTMDEIALYTTKNGKIVKEEFFAKPQ